MQKTSIKNVLAQARKPARLLVMLKKVRNRLDDEVGSHSRDENLKWLESQCSSFADLATELDSPLWEETRRFSEGLAAHAARTLKHVEFNLGGGGIYPLLYFIARYTNPGCIVETGVAAGFSSCAFLSAIRANGRGKLHSSDFPYFRLPNPERYIGILVDESLRDNWTLYIDGDEVNLPRILQSVDRIDVFHYDSDKSYSGRRLAMAMVQGALGKDAIVLMDDIQDNSFFLDHVERTGVSQWRVFEFEGKYVGMIGELKRHRP